MRILRSVTSTLYRHGFVHSSADPFAEAVLVDGGTVAWLGADDTADGLVDRADEVVDLDGALVTPGFVDTHVDLLAVGLDLATTNPGTVPDDPLDDDARLAAYRRALAHAAAHGVVVVHEMACPGRRAGSVSQPKACRRVAHDTQTALRTLLETTADPASALPLVVGYWGGWCDDSALADLLSEVPGLAGVWAVTDGPLDAHGAWLRAPYADTPQTPVEKPPTCADADRVATHVVAATRSGVQASLWVVGDAALDEVLRGVRTAADLLGTPAVAGGRHRVEHIGLADPQALADMAALGLSASVHPAWEAALGDLAAARVGDQAANVYPLADLARAGVPTGFGSAGPVMPLPRDPSATAAPLDPWVGVRAAFAHHQPGQRVSARAAFRSATRGGWRLTGSDADGSGELRVGAPAHLAVWRADELVVQAADGRFSAWSTDARAGTPVLPSLAPDAAPPVCLRTVRSGITLYDTFG